MIYLDNSATTKIDPEVVNAMLPYLNEEYGNPSSKYYNLAITAKKSVDESRGKIAQLIHSNDDEIIFTSGASESNNFIIKGIADYLHIEKSLGNHIVVSKVEHKSILEPCKWLEKRGYKITYLEVNKYGQIEPEILANAITQDTILASIVWGNNEIGTLNNIKTLSSICKEKNIFFHSDATQVLGKVDINTRDIAADFLSFSAHKLYGPKGIGACFIRKTKLGLKQKITPLIHGGTQEGGYRAGTHAVHNIVGFGKACEIATRDMKEYIPRILENETVFKKIFTDHFEKIAFNGHPDEKIPGIISMTIPSISNELLIRKLKDSIAISTGSACSISEPSHVLSAIGLAPSLISSTLRVSLSKYTDYLVDSNKIIESLSTV